MNRWKSDLILLFVAAVWGSGFVAQRLAAGEISALLFNGGRFLLASAVLLLAVRLLPKMSADQRRVTDQNRWWMAAAGVLLFLAAGLQQAGLATTTIGNASFITGLYVVLVPIILFVFLREHVTLLAWLAVVLAVVGVMLLSLQDSFRLAPGDGLVLIGSFAWALHVILVGRLAQRGVQVMFFAALQFGVCGLLNMALALLQDPTSIGGLLTNWQTVVYSALVPIALGFTLQIAGQRHAPPVDSAIILSTEAVFGTLFGWLFLNELLSARQLAGCVLILVAMILAQVRLPERSAALLEKRVT